VRVRNVSTGLGAIGPVRGSRPAGEKEFTMSVLLQSFFGGRCPRGLGSFLDYGRWEPRYKRVDCIAWDLSSCRVFNARGSQNLRLQANSHKGLFLQWVRIDAGEIAKLMATSRPKLVFGVTSSISVCLFSRGIGSELRDSCFDVALTSSPGPELDSVAVREGVRCLPVPMEREISP
jgi:hypothetical protein